MNILFTCAGRRTYLLNYFRENMQPEDRIVATDMQLSAPALQVADAKYQVPAVYADDYIDITLKICKEERIDAVLSLNDLELPILADNRHHFEAIGVTVLVSSSRVVELTFDKYKSAQWLHSVGLKTPKTYLKLDDVRIAVDKKELCFPLFLKPRWGSGSIGQEIVCDMNELFVMYNLLHKKIKQTILARASIGDEYILIQEKLDGKEYGADIMNDLNGNYVEISVKQKLAMRAGETDKAVTVDVPQIRKIGAVIGNALGHIGNLDVDIMQRANGDYCVLEMNPRFGGGFPFSYEAGVNLPLAIIKWLRGESVSPDILKTESGRTFAKNDYLMEIK